MLDQMSMPVLFVVVIVALGVLVLGLLLATRIFGERERSRDARAPRKGRRQKRP